MNTQSLQAEQGKEEPIFGEKLREQFPIFAHQRALRGMPLSYLDTAASSQKPQRIINRISNYLATEHANIHRGAYTLSAGATDLYEAARATVKGYINASQCESIIFTKGATEAINLIASSYGELLHKGNTVLCTILEHHSNIVPWQLLAARRGTKVAFADIADDGTLDLAALRKQIQLIKPKLLAVTSLANALGTLVPLEEVIEIAHEHGVLVMVDACQSIAHMPVDVQKLGCDFLVFSGHKLYGPTGIGVLYGKKDLLEKMPPYQGGGDMIASVSVTGSTWAELPQKFEAGTPPIAEAIGLSEAIRFVESLGRPAIAAYEQTVLHYGYEALRQEPGVTIYGPINNPTAAPRAHASLLSFDVKGIHPHDLASIADSCNVQIRAGHHCAMPLLERLGLAGTARASVGVYSAPADFDALVHAIRKAKRVMRI